MGRRSKTVTLLVRFERLPAAHVARKATPWRDHYHLAHARRCAVTGGGSNVQGNGGGISASHAGLVQVTNSTFRHCSAADAGGAIAVTNSSFDVSAVYMYAICLNTQRLSTECAHRSLRVRRIECSAMIAGGGLSARASTGVIQRSLFNGCFARSIGGALHLGTSPGFRESTVLLLDSLVSSCSAAQGGAVMVDERCTLNVTRDVLEGCYASNEGGAIAARKRAYVSIGKSQLGYNQARIQGAGVQVALSAVCSDGWS